MLEYNELMNARLSMIMDRLMGLKENVSLARLSYHEVSEVVSATIDTIRLPENFSPKQIKDAKKTLKTHFEQLVLVQIEFDLKSKTTKNKLNEFLTELYAKE